ncbi:hypothetical protein SLEP1_g3622 [Rubroshorea leprosula]|uniref:Uncharacterized protein n=1 Tax=Rubroshorea leprosula TaxID=152421 RepID=A0AAV5HVC4_9ROSI|nr:hypothetical protein SLEP1_g3622 [Rubroshorea leprosula]
MSSEETISVVGSEVMPLEYGSMNLESSPSPSSSEKTVEGVVGVGGDSVPIIVVEVKGGRERGYDIDADIVEEVRQYKFELGTRDSLGYLVESYEISSRVLIRPAGVVERACSTPRDHWMPVYAHYLATGLRFPIPELLVDLLLDYSIGLTQLVPNAMMGIVGRIRGDDTEWERGDTEVEELSSWKAKRANQNKFSLNEDEEEEVGKLVRKGENLLNIMDLTSVECIEVAELYGPSNLSEVEMDKFLNTAGGVAIPKKPRKKSKTSTKQVDEGGVGKEVVPSTAAGVEEEEPELQLKRKSREEREALQKKKKVAKAPSSLFEAKNMTRARRFINATFPEVDKHHTRDEALRNCGASVVKHVLEEFMESVKERSLLQRQCDQLQKGKEELEKKNKELQEALNEVVLAVKQLEQERASLSTKLVFEESKRRISESEHEAQAKEITLMNEAYVELKKNVQLLVHNGMEEHISNFISSSSFDNIVNLYRLPTAIIAFTDCRKKVKAEYPKVDITKITFGEQEEGVEENGESMSVDFCPQIKLRWEHEADGHTVFPPNFDFEFVAVEEEEVGVEEDEVEAGVERIEVDTNQPAPEVEIHPVPSDDKQPPLPNEQ